MTSYWIFTFAMENGSMKTMTVKLTTVMTVLFGEENGKYKLMMSLVKSTGIATPIHTTGASENGQIFITKKTQKDHMNFVKTASSGATNGYTKRMSMVVRGGVTIALHGAESGTSTIITKSGIAIMNAYHSVDNGNSTKRIKNGIATTHWILMGLTFFRETMMIPHLGAEVLQLKTKVVMLESNIILQLEMAALVKDLMLKRNVMKNVGKNTALMLVGTMSYAIGEVMFRQELLKMNEELA